MRLRQLDTQWCCWWDSVHVCWFFFILVTVEASVSLSQTKPFRRSLLDCQKMQYFAECTIGEQDITGLVVPGSFKWVLRSARWNHYLFVSSLKVALVKKEIACDHERVRQSCFCNFSGQQGPEVLCLHYSLVYLKHNAVFASLLGRGWRSCLCVVFEHKPCFRCCCHRCFYPRRSRSCLYLQCSVHASQIR